MKNNHKSSESTALHVGVILDGNRRWAAAAGLSAIEGHRKGGEVFRDIAVYAFDKGIKYLSAFVFSTENWQRTEEEVGYLMKLTVKATEKYLDLFNDLGIKILVVGRRQQLPADLLSAIERTESRTEKNTNGTLVLCLNYSGHDEIIDATKQLIKGSVEPEEITSEAFENALYCPEVPPIDLLIRTSGEQRLSGFMLWRSAYSELYFIEKFWPEFTKSDLDKALKWYASRNRRFGV
jgi:undecaprenyl diphosphate synthase